ncbi:hypothetical protein KM043_009839 [Ampulex compressa]|nr:hypothetical protein KM043_009839 [Ampulex compressa]
MPPKLSRRLPSFHQEEAVQQAERSISWADNDQARYKGTQEARPFPALTVAKRTNPTIFESVCGTTRWQVEETPVDSGLNKPENCLPRAEDDARLVKKPPWPLPIYHPGGIYTADISDGSSRNPGSPKLMGF